MLVLQIRDIAAEPATADPELKAKVYAELGVNVTYDRDRRLVVAGATRVTECVWRPDVFKAQTGGRWRWEVIRVWHVRGRMRFVIRTGPRRSPWPRLSDLSPRWFVGRWRPCQDNLRDDLSFADREQLSCRSCSAARSTPARRHKCELACGTMG